MIRRRRPSREIAFSFDSFLDVVANVVGIIIRLILVVWAGARTYGSLTAVTPPSAHGPAGKEVRAIQDPLQDELARHRQDLAAAQARLLEQLRQVQQVDAQEKEVQGKLAGLAARLEKQKREKAGVEKQAARHQSARQTVALSLEELRQKSRQLQQAIKDLEKMPRNTRTLRYHTPVSTPVESEQIIFECSNGRVAFIDMATLRSYLERDLQDNLKTLHSQDEFQGIAGPVGAFRLRYTLERVHEVFTMDGGNIHVTRWEIEPISQRRGETEAQALAAGSDFRRIVDSLDPRQHVVTMFVYPDSFALFRRLRDYLYERDLVVAGNPWAGGRPITFAPNGFRSRGQ
jgi:hypothetical protein